MPPIIKKSNRPRHPPFVDSCFIEKDKPSGKCNFWNSSLVYLSTESSNETFLISPTLTLAQAISGLYSNQALCAIVILDTIRFTLEK